MTEQSPKQNQKYPEGVEIIDVTWNDDGLAVVEDTLPEEETHIIRGDN